jgi:hypothetical protein
MPASNSEVPVREENEMKDEVTPESMDKLVNVLRDAARKKEPQGKPVEKAEEDLRIKKPPARS